ncbi:MAG: signal recognition particle-docking protein FtsY [Candidatus Marinimicrobia bacterium]|nr:signal recognition particle-docking protein FtsY [Candidatus Neomarinimicrobiota bacterium]
MAKAGLVRGLAKTKQIIAGGIGKLLRSGRLKEEELDKLEEVLITCDIGFDIAQEIIERVKRYTGSAEEGVKEKIISVIKDYLPNVRCKFEMKGNPHVVLMVGANGTGKTTTIGKLAYKFRQEGKRVLVVAADTFRAAAGEQLQKWAERAGVDFFWNPKAKDPGSVVYDALNGAIARGYDVVFIDTAGRLHTKLNLMNELGKIKKVSARVVPLAPHDIWLVLDASFGQNGVIQAEQFMRKVGLTGIVLAKIDGTAKGGVVVSILKKYGIPICYLGTGESIGDLSEFDLDEYLDAVFGD